MANLDDRAHVLLIKNVTVIPNPLGNTILQGQSVLVEGDTVAAVGPTEELCAEYSQATCLDGRGQWLLPGLVDAHTHLYSALTAGMPGPKPTPQNFPQVLKRVWWRWDKALRDTDNYQSAVIGSLASVRNGITTMIDHHASPHAIPDSLDHVAAGVEKVGLRACLAYEVSDRDGPTHCEEGIAENRRFILASRTRGDNRLRGLFGLHAVFSLSDETLRCCAAEGQALGVGFHMHMLEHRPEKRRFARTHSQSIPEFLAEIGILGPQTLTAHTVHVTEEDIRTLKRTGTFNVHNPQSNLGNGVGIAPVRTMLALGQPVGLGSDGYFDLPYEMTLAKILQCLRGHNPSAFSAPEALQMVYGNSVAFASRVFDCRLGKVAPGYAADLILLPYDPVTPVSGENLAGHILSALVGGPRTALVAGDVVLRDGELTHVDEAAERARARALTPQICERL